MHLLPVGSMPSDGSERDPLHILYKCATVTPEPPAQPFTEMPVLFLGLSLGFGFLFSILMY